MNKYRRHFSYKHTHFALVCLIQLICYPRHAYYWFFYYAQSVSLSFISLLCKIRYIMYDTHLHVIKYFICSCSVILLISTCKFAFNNCNATLLVNSICNRVICHHVVLLPRWMIRQFDGSLYIIPIFNRNKKDMNIECEKLDNTHTFLNASLSS